MDGSIPVMVEETFHHVQRCVEPTNTAAQECAGTFGLVGSTEQELTGDAEFFIAERIPMSSVPVGTRA